MEAIWVESIGIIAGILGVIAWIPQIQEVWIEKQHEGISLPTFYLVWLVYGLLIESIAMILANIAALGCILSIIIGVNKLR